MERRHNRPPAHVAAVCDRRPADHPTCSRSRPRLESLIPLEKNSAGTDAFEFLSPIHDFRHVTDDLNIYLRLTQEFNAGRPRVLLAGGQAVVLYRLAMMSKDGDWIVREDEEALSHVLRVLDSHGASYRFGAPLALPWMRGGWSAHFEFPHDGLRVRTDFVTRPPRLDEAVVEGLWRGQDRQPYTAEDAKLGAEPLILTKQTNREKDYVAIGELARLLEDPLAALRHSRSVRDILELAARNPDLLALAEKNRPCLRAAAAGPEALGAALDAERRGLMKLNEERLARYEAAARQWAAAWPALQKRIRPLSLPEAHDAMVEAAMECLPAAIPRV